MASSVGTCIPGGGPIRKSFDRASCSRVQPSSLSTIPSRVSVHIFACLMRSSTGLWVCVGPLSKRTRLTNPSDNVMSPLWFLWSVTLVSDAFGVGSVPSEVAVRGLGMMSLAWNGRNAVDRLHRLHVVIPTRRNSRQEVSEQTARSKALSVASACSSILWPECIEIKCRMNPRPEPKCLALHTGQLMAPPGKDAIGGGSTGGGASAMAARKNLILAETVDVRARLAIGST